jgi:hypothetical protein
MNWERTMRELHSIRARMRRERYREELCLRKALVKHYAEFPFHIRRLRLNHDVSCCNILSRAILS